MPGQRRTQRVHAAAARHFLRARLAITVVALTVAAVTVVACGDGRDAPMARDDGSQQAPAESIPPAPTLAGETSSLPKSAPDALGTFRLSGNEPFWGVRVTDAGIAFTTPDYPAGIRFPAVAPEVGGTTLRWVAITAPPEAHTLEVVLTESSCQDSMADRTWPYMARVVFDGTAYEGCGERDGSPRR